MPLPPSGSAVCFTDLWVLSLLVSLTCAVMALLIQQSAHRRLEILWKSPNLTSPNRDRIHALFFPNSSRQYFTNFDFSVTLLYVLILLSLSLFFAGILVYLLKINYSVFIIAASWIGFSCVIYLTYAFKLITQMSFSQVL